VPEGQVLVCVGRLCAAKAQHLLVEALARVVGRYPGVKLVLIGDGDTRSRIEQTIVAQGMERNVELAGWRTNAQVREALKDARALVLPSLAEGLPIVIMESFALGRPVLSTVINGIPELVDETCGWLVAPGDVDALVPALEALLAADRDALSGMGRIGRARVEELHDQDANAARLRDLIGQAIAGRVEPAARAGTDRP
jgi:glycosyltransferase involved in cell wall biosynthesis